MHRVMQRMRQTIKPLLIKAAHRWPRLSDPARRLYRALRQRPDIPPQDSPLPGSGNARAPAEPFSQKTAGELESFDRWVKARADLTANIRMARKE